MDEFITTTITWRWTYAGVPLEIIAAAIQDRVLVELSTEMGAQVPLVPLGRKTACRYSWIYGNVVTGFGKKAEKVR